MANSFRCGKSIVALANWETASRRQMAHLISLAIDLILKFLIFDLQTLDHFLAEVGSFCEFFLDLFVNSDVSVEGIDLLLHLVVFGQQLFGLFRLVFELIC